MTEVKSAPLTAREFPGFVVNELRGRQVRIDPDAADFLIQAVGQDLRALSAAASQLANDFEGQPLTIEMVKKYFGGRAEAKSFAVADHTLYGQTARALEELRWALDRGTAPVLVTSAMAGGLRSLARFMSAPRGMRNNDLMREVGVPAWKLDTLRRQSHGWDADGLGRAIRSVARADADIKGQASDPAYALEKMVLDVVRARPRADGSGAGAAKGAAPVGTTPLWWAQVAAQSEAACLLMADLRLAAWFLWMTPLEAALSSALGGVERQRPWPRRRCRPRRPRGTCARRSSARTSRPCCARAQPSFCRLRLIWDLMFATAGSPLWDGFRFGGVRTGPDTKGDDISGRRARPNRRIAD